jgi:hypothetical protein
VSRFGAKFAWVVILVAVLAGVLVTAASALRFTDESYLTPTGTVGTPYSHRFTAPPAGSSGAGCDPPYIVRVDSGALPPGLSLATDGWLTGTPTHAGTWSFWVSIKDDPADKPWCNPMSAEREFSVKIVGGLVIGPESASPGTVGTPYSLAMTATLSDPKTWSISTGALPPGLTLNATSGLISGTPTTVGSYTFTVRAVVDATRTDTKTLTIEVRAPLSVAASQPFTAAHLARGEMGISFQGSLAATGGTGSYTWSVSSGALPPGLALGATGTITGRPRTAGAYRFAVSVADTEGRTAIYDAALSIAPRLSITSRLLRPGTVGRAYRTKLATSGGVNPKRWSARGLPPGVRVDTRLGTLLGTPRRAGVYRVSIGVADALDAKSTGTFRVLVRPSPLP